MARFAPALVRNNYVVASLFSLVTAFSLLSPASAQVVIDYTYDDLNRLTSVTRDDGPLVDYTYDEVGNTTSHVVSNSPDTDGDQIANFADLDDDNDQIPDAWEIQYGLDPLDSADASSDSDGDGLTALQEFQAGTDPTVNNNGEYGVDEDIPFLPVWAMVLLVSLFAGLGNRFQKWRATSIALALLTVGVLLPAADAVAQTADDLAVPLATLQQNITPPDPGWYQGEAEAVSSAQAQQILGVPAKPGLLDRFVGFFSTQSAVATPSDYSQLAEALENDPRRIYQYVRNHFEYVPYYGALKGPYLTLHERAGNDFDQAALLIDILRAAGFTANFRYGVATISTIDPVELQAAADWLGTEVDASLIANSFSNGGVPVTLYSNRIEFDHVWVEVDISGSIVSLDPSFKLSTAYSPIDLDTAMGFSETGLLAVAGGTLGTDSIQSMSASGVDSYLTTLTTQLQSYLKQNYPNAYMEEVIGGYKIIADNSTTLPAALPLSVVPSFAAWSAIPSNYIHTVQLQHGGINKTYDIPNIAGRKLSVSYSGSSVVIDPPPAGAADFGSVAIGQDGPTFTWSPGNPNSVVIQVTSTLSGPGASAFSFVSGGGTQNIPANNGTVDVQVQFSGSGQTAGRKNAVLTFIYSYQGSSIGTQTVDLTGVVDAERIAEIYIDDVLDVAESSPTGNLNDLVVTVDHPYAASSGSFADQTVTFNLDRNGSYVLASAFGGDKHSTLLSERQRLLNRMTLEGKASDSREVVSETLNVIGQTWMQQTQLNDDILASLSGVRGIRHHRFGIAGQEEGYFVDIKAQYVSSPARVAVPEEGEFQASGFVASAMEHSVLEQLQGASNPGISTIKIFALNNQNGGKLFLANSSNFASVQSQLSNYTSGDLSQFQTLVNAGHTLILPENGAVTLNDWSGKGYVDYFVNGSARSQGMIIGGGLNGGFASQPQQVSPTPTQNESLPEITPKANIPTPTAADPVDLGSGAFLSSMTDIALGGSGPRGLGFSRSYNSQLVTQDVAGLGRGWNHNYNMYLSTHSDVESALGEGTPFQALPMIVAAHITRTLMEPTQPSLQQWAVSALVSDWAMNQLLNKSVTVHIGSQALTYKELPDGSFVSPAGVTIDLVRLGDNTFELRERFGTTYKFNANDNIQSLTDIDGNALTFTYSSNQLTQIADNYGRTLTLAYTGNQLISVSDSTGRSVSYSHTGETLTSANGLESAFWQYTYDPLFRMETVIDPETHVIVDNTYDDFDRVIEQVAPRKTGSAIYKMHYTGFSSAEENPLGDRKTYSYDIFGRTIAVEDALGNTGRNVYDGQGQVTKSIDAQLNETNFIYDGNNNVTEIKDGNKNSTVFGYDTFFRLTSVTNPLSQTSETDYDTEHHPVAVRDAIGNEVVNAYAPNGLITSSTDPRNTTQTFTYDALDQPATEKVSTHPTVATQYDTRGQLTQITDQEGAVTQYQYDDRGLLIQETDPLNTDSFYTYDKIGQLTNTVDRNGDSVTATYTPSGKLDIITYPDTSTVQFTYDSRDNLSQMVDPSGTSSNTYDELNRLISYADANGFTVGYEYDSRGQISKITYPDGKTVSYQYDNLGQISQVAADWLSNTTASYQYDAARRLVGATQFNNVNLTYSYDNADRLTGISYQGSSPITDYQYTLDGNGNRTRAVINAEPVKPKKLINDSTTNLFNTARNRLESSNGLTLTYDNEGQLISKGSTAYAFDYAHRLVQVGTSTFVYDGVGNRISATRAGVTTKYIYDARGNLLAEANASNQIIRHYIYGRGLMAVYTNGTLYNYHFDGTGNTVALSDQSQTIVNRYAYGAYGKIKAAEETIQQPFQYVGQLGAFTESENFYYMKARYYDAELGRFIKQDPAGISGGLNLYAYVGGNPLVLVDPTGLSAQDFGFADVINFGIDAISVILIGADLILGGPTGEGIAPAIGLQGLKIGSKKAIKEGIYEFVDTSGKKYVGQSGNIAKRLQDHVRSGKLDPSQVKNVKVKEVLGGKTKREIAEQKRINEITNNVGAKSPKVSNQKNPIGPKRQHLLD